MSSREDDAPYGEPDRTAEDDRGRTLYGYDDDGRTTWYYGDGTCDCETRQRQLMRVRHFRRTRTTQIRKVNHVHTYSVSQTNTGKT